VLPGGTVQYARQIDSATVGLTHVIGLGSACAVHILEKASAAASRASARLERRA